MHLSPEQRATLRGLFDQCDMVELLIAVAGIVSHDVGDFETALDASELVRKAASLVHKSKQKRGV